MAKRLARQAEMYPVSQGPSIREMIQEDLDHAVDDLMSMANANHSRKTGVADAAEAKGYAYGLARALAIMTNPYDFEAALTHVRAEAMERWREREHGDSGVSVAPSREV